MVELDAVESRNILFFGKSNLMKIRKSSVLVVGVGGLGCIVAEVLTRLGVGELSLIDNGVVDEPDLGRQLLYNIDDLGKKKVIAAKKRLKEINKFVEITEIDLDVKDISTYDLRRYDCVCDCLDNFQSRFVLEGKLENGQCLVHGGIENDYGQLTTIIKGETVLLKDIYNDIEDKGIIPVSTPAVFVIGSLMAQEAVNVLLEKPRLANILLVAELDDFTFTKINLER